MSRLSSFDHAFGRSLHRPCARPRLPLAVACAASFVALVPAEALAQTGVRAVRLGYGAPASCPDATAFETQLRARSARIVVSADSRSDVRIRITGRGERFDGDLVLTDAGGSETKRHVDGTCPDVVAALSLITAVALDPMASTASHPDAASAAGKTTPVEVPPGLKPASNVAAPPTAPAPTVAATPPASKPVTVDDEPAGVSTHHGWRWSIGAGVGVTGGLAPAVAVSVPAFIDVARWSRTLAAPSFRVRFERSSVDVGGSGARFTWTAGSLEGCPIALATAAFRVSPCVRAEGGVLEVQGESGVSKSALRPWFSVGGLARVRLGVVGALFLELEGGGLLPIVRDRFFLEPNDTVHRAPSIVAAGGASLGASFW